MNTTQEKDEISLFIKCLYNIILFRRATQSEVEHHLKNLENFSMIGFFEKKVREFLWSTERKEIEAKELLKKTNVSLVEDDLKKTIDTVSRHVHKNGYASHFLLAELHFILSNFDEAEFLYKEVASQKDESISKISISRLAEIESCRSINANLLNVVRNIDNLRSENLIDFEKPEIERIITKKVFRKHLLKSRYILSDALGQYICENSEKLDLDSFVQIFQTAAILKGWPIENSKEIAIRLKQIKEKNTTSNLRSLPEELIFVVGGFFYSGSSAVYDYFRGHNKSRTIADFDIEIPFIGAFYHATKNADSRKIINFSLKYILDLHLPESDDDLNLKRPEFSPLSRSEHGLTHLNVNDYLDLACRFFSNLSISNNETNRIALYEFIRGLAAPNVEKNCFIALNQAPTAIGVECFSALPKNSKFIAVYRDPRDQYLDQITHGAINAGIYMDVHGFIEKYKRDRATYIHKKENLFDPQQFTETYFEDFITKESERKRVCNFLNVEYQDSVNFFNPALSQKNIFKYKNWSNQLAIREIESQLAEYLWSGSI